jgi:transaldolase
MCTFLDTANIDYMRRAANLGIIGGVTINPMLVAREGEADLPLCSRLEEGE